jgi:hypothetical protein
MTSTTKLHVSWLTGYDEVNFCTHKVLVGCNYCGLIPMQFGLNFFNLFATVGKNASEA